MAADWKPKERGGLSSKTLRPGYCFVVALHRLSSGSSSIDGPAQKDFISPKQHT